MIENVKITGLTTTLEIDRTKTNDYVLDTVNIGNRDTQYSLINTIDLVGLERDIWYKRLSVVEITGWAIRDDRDPESLYRRKRRLNHFIVPNRQYTMVYEGKTLQFIATESIETKSRALENFLMVQSETDIIYNYYHLTFLPTAEVKWAIIEQDNNEFWRKFHITGVSIDPIWKNRSVLSADNTYNTPMFSFPLTFNKDDDKVVFGIHYGQNSVILNYEGASPGTIITVQSSGTLSDLVITLQNGATVQTFSIDGTFEPNTTIVIDTREGFNTVTADGIDITENVFLGSSWFRILNGINIFHFYQKINADETPLFSFPLSFNQDESRVVFGIHSGMDTSGQLDVNVTIRQED